MRLFVRFALVLVLAVSAAPLAAPYVGSAPTAPPTLADRELPKANYDLASRWTAAKVGKYVFSTSVTPHWLEFSDRFWYDYETPAGRRWWVVDPVKKAKTPLFDNAKMAAQLTRILRTPYDAQHLPVGTIRFFDNDTKFRFSVTLPRDARVENAAGEEITGMTQTQDQGRGGGGGGAGRGGGGGRGVQQQQQGGRAGAPGAPAPVGNATWWLEYDIATGTVVLNDKYKPEATTNPNWATVSPDKKYVIYSRNFNLFMMDADNFEKAKKNASDPSIAEVQLTTDGERNYGFGRGGGAGNQDQQQQDVVTEQDQTQGGGRGNAQQSEADKKYGGPRVSAGGMTWSQDNRMASVTRTDQRKVADLWVINALANPRPTLNTYKYGMPGEENQPQAELHVIDLDAKKELKIKTEAFKDQQMALATAPVTNLERERAGGPPEDDLDQPQGRGGGAGPVSRWISTSGDKIYYNRTSRDLKRIDIVEGDTKTGESRVVIPERSNTYIEIQPLRLISNGKQAIHWSERDGWGHYYLYDISGKLIRQVTSGEYVTTGITAVDEKTRMLYFTAVGREPGEDPYYQHVYSANLDTGAVKLLDPGNASHTASMNDKCTLFVDTASRIDSPPESVLYDGAGNKLMELEKTDVSLLMEAGFKYPEAFTVKADDGITDLYGVMYKPFDFDPAKKYPIILYVYPGPQTESVTKTFSVKSGAAAASSALANVGFIVIEVGNRGGNPQRSKWYHNYGYGNLRDYGVPDKKAAVEQLAKRYAFVDLDRVGIWGHSGGGFMTAAALFGFPDFFKVGISESGNHDNSIYNRWWSEKHDGVKEITAEDGKVTFQYDIDKNQDIAGNLKGHLLLITGDVDNNVHPSNTYRVMDALIRANKRFDFILLPGQPHGYGPMADYAFWRRVDYFAEHLLGAAPSSIDIVELDRERQIRR